MLEISVSGIWFTDFFDGPPLHNKYNCVGADFGQTLKNIKCNTTEISLTRMGLADTKSE